MLSRRFALVFAFVLFAGASIGFAQESTRLLHQPTISNDHVAFVYAGDIWKANLDGSDPVRMTVAPGAEITPYFSPDGKWIAFTGRFGDNYDVYVVSVNGGEPKRLTYHPEPDVVRGWTPDGKDILFCSYRDNETRRYNRFYTISPEGGMPTELILPRAERGSYSPDGSKIAYTYLHDPFNTWKRYRGGLQPVIWIFDFATQDIVEIPHENANDTYPVWIGNTVYFLSDRNFIMNVFAYDTQTKQVRQVTNHANYDVKTLTGNNGKLVYEQAGMVHMYDPSTGSDTTIPITINPDLPATRPHYVDASDDISSFSISPTGARAVFEARGDIFTVPAEKGDIRDLTNTSGAHERYPAWSPDGGQVAYLSDQSGEYELYLKDQKGLEDPEVISLGPPNYYYGPTWSPDGKSILYIDRGITMYRMDLKDKKPVVVDRDNQSARVFNPSWSPDSRWITYTKTLPNHYRAVFIYDTKNGEVHQITDGMSDAVSPVFSRDGKYLFFAASTNYGLNISGLDMSSYERPVRRALYVAVLQKDTPSPFEPESDEEAVKKDDEKKEEAKEKEEEKSVTVAIDFDGLDQRILALPEPEKDYSTLLTADDGHLFYLNHDTEGNGPDLVRFSMKDRKSETFLSGVRNYEVSQDGKKLIYTTGNKTYAIVETGAKPNAADGKLSLSGMKMKVDPRAEWAQEFREAWRIERDFFYDPNMQGAVWPAVYDKYQPFVKYIGNRSDLNFLIGEMIGELVIGHAYVGGGDLPKEDHVPVGLLGADYTEDNGYYRFSKIFSGLNWNPDLRAPLTEPDIGVKEGDYLLAVNGVPLQAPTNLYSAFLNTAGKQTVITVNSKPTMKDSREVTVVPVSSERGLRMRDWVEKNREKVDQATDGRVGYVYLPNTAEAGYESFNRYYFSQLDKEAVIFDERFNAGGSAADYMIDMMSRPLLSWWMTREGKFTSTPYASIYGPKVMIINENAGSGGDALPFYFHERKIGKLIGKRTWGGLVGISGTPSLIDGGYVTAPAFAVMSPDGKWVVENHGVDPDIEVQQIPKEVIAGHDPQLDKAISVMQEELKSYTPPEPHPEPIPERAARPKEGTNK